MDFESIKRLGLDYLGIDINNSFETYNPFNSNHTIFIHLLKQDKINPSNCLLHILEYPNPISRRASLTFLLFLYYLVY